MGLNMTLRKVSHNRWRPYMDTFSVAVKGSKSLVPLTIQAIRF